MSDILKYTIINPIADKDKPFIKHGILYFPITEKYRYFCEAIQENAYGGYDYFLLLSKIKFSPHCRTCQTDAYNRVKIKLKGSIKEYVIDKCEEDGNIEITYVESGEDYDVFSLV